MQQHKTAIIIGSGVAGMAAAIRLTVQGFRVTVYEKNNCPGGKLTAFKKDGFHFDAGPSLFTQPQYIRELFDLAGENIQDYFSYKQVATSCNYFFENGKSIAASSNKEAFAKQLNEQFGEDELAVHQYLSNAEKNYIHIGSVFLNHSLHKRKTWLNKRIIKAIGALKFSYLTQSLHKYNTSKFKTPEVTQLFNRFATYNGSNPYKAPAMLSLIPHLEMNEGTYYPDGGMISITNALHQLAEKKGVRFVFNQPVQHIIHHEGKARGVVVNNENIYADVVISNADVHFTYKYLLQNDYKVKHLNKQERSSSALVFYWGINKEFDKLGLHNILFSNNYKEEFESIFKRKNLSSDPTIYINITSKMDAVHAPTGNENWFVMINAPAHYNQQWNEGKENIKKLIIEKINRVLQTSIEDYIVTEEILHPQMIEEKTNAHTGSLYGNSSNSKLAAFFRHPNFTRSIKNLYFCGGTVHPGGGIPLCMKSAEIAANLIHESFKKPTAH